MHLPRCSAVAHLARLPRQARPTTALLAGALAAAAAAGTSRDAAACGGFFCSSAAPVDQAGELILFDVQGRDVTMHVQIAYDGPSENFGWILPIPTDHPDEPVDMGTEALFQALLQSTQPIVQLDQRVEGQCRPEPWECFAWGETDDAEAGGFGGEGEGEGDAAPEVEVLLQDQVGPFDVAVLNANDVGILMQWLDDNGYDIPAETGEYLDPYIGEAHFVAMKLTKGAEAGDIQPVVLRFRADQPMIPLRLTAVASTDDMPVFAWFLGDGRAAPANWAHVEPNLARIPWQTCGFWPGCQAQWQALVGDAADEAGGRAFATAFHGRSQATRNMLPNPAWFDLDDLKRQRRPSDFVQALLEQGFPRDSKMQSLLRRFIPKPEALDDVDDRSFYNCLRCYEDEIAASGLRFDPAAFVAAIEEQIVGPLTDIWDRFSARPDLTLLYTEISPGEMSDDPLFLVNRDLPDVAQVRTATLITECGPDVLQADAQFRLEYMGRTPLHAGTPSQEGRGAYVPDESLPAARRIEQMDVEGPPRVTTDNSAGIDAAVAAAAQAALEGRPAARVTAPEDLTCDAVCCQDGDPCGWQWNGQCDCGGELPWDNRPSECGEVQCNPGAQVQCVCPDGAVGAQTCQLDGARYGACDCEDGRQPGPDDWRCTPREAVVCQCPDGGRGIQRCADDGRAWGACDCTGEAQAGPAEADRGPGSGGAEERCVPGKTQGCTCRDGALGAMQCDDDGRFGVCSCEPFVEAPGGGGKPSASKRDDQRVGCACELSPGPSAGGPDGVAWLTLLAGLAVWARRR